MPRFVFTKKFDWRVKPRVWKEFKAGARLMVPRRCAEEAFAAGCGHYEAPRLEADDGERS